MTALEQLRSALEAMTRGAYVFNESTGDIESPTGGPTPYLSKSICQMYVGNVKPNAAGIVALRNAAPALIALAEACEAEEQAVCRNQPLVSTVAGGHRAHMISDVEGRCIGGMHIDTCPVALARAARIAALEAIRRLG